MRTTFPVPALAAVLVAAVASVGAAGCSDVGTAEARPSTEGPRCPIVINEVAAAGEPADWFELVNVSTSPVDLADYRFSDGTVSRTASLPPSVLAPGARHVEEVTTAGDGFRLGADDALVLYRTGDDSPCDRVRWTDGDAPSRGSYARIPDGRGRFETVLRDSRGVANR